MREEEAKASSVTELWNTGTFVNKLQKNNRVKINNAICIVDQEASVRRHRPVKQSVIVDYISCGQIGLSTSYWTECIYRQ